MKKQMIVLIALVVAVFAAPASAETFEVRGTIVELDAASPILTINTPAGTPVWEQGHMWDYSTFHGFWCDLDGGLATETLTILAKERDYPTENTLKYPTDREIGEGSLVYTTHPVFHEYELHANKPDPDRTTQTDMEEAYDGDGIGDAVPHDLLDHDIGLCVDSDNPGGDCGYFLEGWIGEKYVAIDNNADKLCKLLVEFEDDDKKTLATGEEWDMGGGFALEVVGIDATGEKATIQLSENCYPYDDLLVTGCLDTSGSEQDRVYTYTADLAWETDIPVFSCYVNAISSETDTVEIMYVFLIDNDVLEINTGDRYGIMEVMTASISQIVLRNNEYSLDLDTDTTEHIMGGMYFKTADDDNAIRFYPCVIKNEPGDYEIRGNVVNLACVQTADLIWNSYNFAGFWYDLDDNLMTEELRLVAGTLDATTYDRTIDEDCLSYRTSSVYQQYKLYTNEGLTVDSDHPGGDTGYWIEGWIGERYVAIDGKADKLTKPLVEFDRYDVKTLNSGDIWDIGDGFVLKLMGINDAGNMATLQLFKNGVPLEGSLKCIDTSTGIKQDRVYTYLKDVADEDNIPIFSCYVAAVFKEGSTSYVQLKYVFLIDDDVIKIETSDEYGVMEVMTASSTGILLRNDETTIDLDTDTTEHIIGDMYFKTADDPYAIRFYPFAERTIDGEEPTPPPDSIPAIDSDGDGVPNAWDDEPDTSDGYYTDSHGRGRKWGDMNGDGELTSVDALMILQAAVENIDL